MLSLLVVVLACAALVVLTTLLHYEVLRGLNAALPPLKIPARSKLLVVLLCAFGAHVLEMAMYGVSTFSLIRWGGVGTLVGAEGPTLLNCIYFSMETYTSLGFGDIAPQGAVRLLAGIEALNGLLLIGWSASYLYIAMERFWKQEDA